MKYFFFTLISFFILFKPVFSQEYTGKVVDAETGEPIQYTHVFFAGTSIGCVTDSVGEFLLKNKGNTNIPIIFSLVGYETKTLSIPELQNHNVIKLVKSNFNIEEVDVLSAKSGWSKAKMMSIFKEEFLGKSDNAQSCKILNENDIYLFYNSTTKTLHANSQKPLHIKNKMLGYLIDYQLEYFIMTETEVKFRGHAYFEEIPMLIGSHQEGIIKNRNETYLGSIMHCMRYFYNNIITDPDTVYDIRLVSLTNYYLRENIKVITEKEKKQTFDISNLDTIEMSLPIEIKPEPIFNQFHIHDKNGNYLTKKAFLRDEMGTRKLCWQGKLRILFYPKFMSSYLVPKVDCIEIDQIGYYNPDDISWSGSMSKKRIGDLLPFDFQPN